MKHIAIIPARAGSKSIVNKNLVRVGKKRLIDMTIDYALHSGLFDKIYLSTDIECLFTEDHGCEVIQRQPSLCDDTSLMTDVVLDALSRTNHTSGYIWLLQPTSPLRNREDTTEILRLLDKGPQSVISVCGVGANHPNRMYTIKCNNLWPLRFTSFKNKQDLPDVYIRNGAFYVVEYNHFKKTKSFYGKSCIPYLMPVERSINVDSTFDLAILRTVLE